MDSEMKKGNSLLTNLKVKEGYPNFRKENNGKAGALLFTGTRVK